MQWSLWTEYTGFIDNLRNFKEFFLLRSLHDINTSIKLKTTQNYITTKTKQTKFSYIILTNYITTYE
jgi:hypothetical protein